MADPLADVNVNRVFHDDLLISKHNPSDEALAS
jgi:hypothetical protein